MRSTALALCLFTRDLCYGGSRNKDAAPVVRPAVTINGVSSSTPTGCLANLALAKHSQQDILKQIP